MGCDQAMQGGFESSCMAESDAFCYHATPFFVNQASSFFQPSSALSLR
jgi:hypothetical protein